MPQAAILTIGDEILLGEIQDSNSTWLAQELVKLGIDPVLRLSAGDRRESILDALEFARKQSNILIVTGGLGPTRDDISKHCLADFFGSSLSENPEALADLEEKLRKRGREMNALVRTQALHPDKARLLKNKVGTAPGIWFEENAFHCFALPGVPYEMKQIFEDEVIPELRKFAGQGFILHRFFRTAALPETNLAMRLENLENQLPQNLKLAYLPSGGEVKLRLTGRGQDGPELTRAMNTASEEILRCLGNDVYAAEDRDLAAVVDDLLVKNSIRLLCRDESILGRMKQKFREAGRYPDFPGELQGKGSEIEISFEVFPDREDVLIRLHRYQDGRQLEESGYELRPFGHKDIFRNMLAIRALDLIRRSLLPS